MDGSSHRSRRANSYPSFDITRPTRTSFGLRPQRSSLGRLALPDSGEVIDGGKQTPQAANDAVSVFQQSSCEKGNLSSESVASNPSTIVTYNQTTHSRQARLRCL